MNEVEVYRLRERLARLVREEPELVVALLVGLAQGGRFEVVVREERIGGAPAQGMGFTSGETVVTGYGIERR